MEEHSDGDEEEQQRNAAAPEGWNFIDSKWGWTKTNPKIAFESSSSLLLVLLLHGFSYIFANDTIWSTFFQFILDNNLLVFYSASSSSAPLRRVVVSFFWCETYEYWWCDISHILSFPLQGVASRKLEKLLWLLWFFFFSFSCLNPHFDVFFRGWWRGERFKSMFSWLTE